MLSRGDEAVGVGRKKVTDCVVCASMDVLATTDLGSTFAERLVAPFL